MCQSPSQVGGHITSGRWDCAVVNLGHVFANTDGYIKVSSGAKANRGIRKPGGPQKGSQPKPWHCKLIDWLIDIAKRRTTSGWIKNIY